MSETDPATLFWNRLQAFMDAMVDGASGVIEINGAHDLVGQILTSHGVILLASPDTPIANSPRAKQFMASTAQEMIGNLDQGVQAIAFVLVCESWTVRYATGTEEENRELFDSAMEYRQHHGTLEGHPDCYESLGVMAQLNIEGCGHATWMRLLPIVRPEGTRLPAHVDRSKMVEHLVPSNEPGKDVFTMTGLSPLRLPAKFGMPSPTRGGFNVRTR